MRFLFVLFCTLLVLLMPGCLHIPDGPVIGGMAEAYDVAGPNIEVSADGAVICTTMDPIAQPCVVKYGATQEAWEPLLRALGIPFEAVLQLVGRSLIPIEPGPSP